MKVTWIFHRVVPSEYRWIDTPEADADATPGLLARTGRELEATLSLDGVVEIRDVVWPLAWRLCLEPVRVLLGEGQTEWLYRCYEENKPVMLRVDGDMVHARREGEPEHGFPASEFWPAMVAAGARIVALAERDRGANDRDVMLLRASLDTAQAILRERGWAP